MNCIHEKEVAYLGQKVQLLISMVEDLGHNIDAIYKELDLVDNEEELQWFDLCDCDKTYGHMCEEYNKRYGRV